MSEPIRVDCNCKEWVKTFKHGRQTQVFEGEGEYGPTFAGFSIVLRFCPWCGKRLDDYLPPVDPNTGLMTGIGKPNK